MTLSQMFDHLDTLIMDHRPISEIKAILTLLRDQVEALHRDHSALKTAHAELVKAKEQADLELAKLKESIAKTQKEQRETLGMGNIGEEQW